MALKKFVPDPDIDPDDEEAFGTGDWFHDDGTQLYGQGDPELARELLARNDASPAEADARRYSEELGLRGANGQPLLGSNDERADVTGSPISPEEVKARRYAEELGVTDILPKAKPASPGPAAPSGAPEGKGGWEDAVPPQVSNALREQATAAGLNPDILAAIVSQESGWNPAEVNKKTGKHAGLIQFSEAGWKGVANAAGRPDVSWQEMRGMSAEEQVPFVVAYYKDKGLTPESTAGDYYKRTFMPGFAKEGDDFVLGERGSQEMKGDVRSGKVWDQNRGLDLDGDGRITNGEVRAVGDRKYASQHGGGGAGGGLPVGVGGAGAGAPGAPQAFPQGGMPPTVAGLPAHAATVSGTPLTAQQIADRRQGILDRTDSAVTAQQQATAARLQGRQEAMAYVQQTSQKEKTDALAALQKNTQIKAQAQAKIDKDVTAEVAKVDPRRYVKNMSTGDIVLGTIGVMMSVAGQALLSTQGINTPNMALQQINKAIDDDIALQKDQIARGEHAKDIRVAHWQKVMGNADDGITAARIESSHAAAGLLQAKLMGVENADIRAQGEQAVQQLQEQGMQLTQQLADKENERLQIQYQAPAAPKGGKEKLGDMIRAAKEARQELEISGLSEQEIDEVFRQNGMPLLKGETVPQRTAREGVERGQDEETSKELEAVDSAERTWKTIKAKLDGISDHALVNEELYRPGMFGAGAVGSLTPGLPGKGETDSLAQALEEGVLKQGQAISGAAISDDALDRIRQSLIGSGNVAGMRRGVATMLENLEAKRKAISTRRGQSAERLGGRMKTEGLAPVTGRIGR